jgi:hypothetical protein
MMRRMPAQRLPLLLYRQQQTYNQKSANILHAMFLILQVPWSLSQHITLPLASLSCSQDPRYTPSNTG